MSLVPSSKTTVFMATFRAIESTRPEKERLLYDPFAQLFISRFYRSCLPFCTIPLFYKVLAGYIEMNWPGVLSAGVARTKKIDEMIIKAVREDGINQIIILSAGFDTRAHRLNIGLPVNFVEVDHPAVQDIKRAQLAQVMEHPVTLVDYIPIDINKQPLAEVMPALLHLKHYKTLFLWEGVTTYLKAAAVDTIFQYIKSFPSGTQTIFTYIDKRVLEEPDKYYGFRRIDKTLRKGGDYWNFGMYPEDIHRFLANRNMELCYDGGADRYRKEYYGDKKARRMKGYEYFRLAHVVVK